MFHKEGNNIQFIGFEEEERTVSFSADADYQNIVNEMVRYIIGTEKYALELISFIESTGRQAPEASPLVWRGLKHRLVEIVKGEG